MPSSAAACANDGSILERFLQRRDRRVVAAERIRRATRAEEKIRSRGLRSIASRNKPAARAGSPCLDRRPGFRRRRAPGRTRSARAPRRVIRNTPQQSARAVRASSSHGGRVGEGARSVLRGAGVRGIRRGRWSSCRRNDYGCGPSRSFYFEIAGRISTRTHSVRSALAGIDRSAPCASGTQLASMATAAIHRGDRPGRLPRRRAECRRAAGATNRRPPRRAARQSPARPATTDSVSANTSATISRRVAPSATRRPSPHLL